MDHAASNSTMGHLSEASLKSSIMATPSINKAIRYQGGKGGAGVFQNIINLMPPHQTYIETHFGGGNIYFRKKKAASSIVIDIDAAVTSKIAIEPGLVVLNDDARSVLRNYAFIGDELVYLDPPYMHETRTKKKIYNYEYTDLQHENLLSLILTIPAAVMISGYRSSLYDSMLAGWHRHDFNAMTRGGLRVESVWFNFEPITQHDSQYLGDSFRCRERIKRQQNRWIQRLKKMPVKERMAMLDLITKEFY